MEGEVDTQNIDLNNLKVTPEIHEAEGFPPGFKPCVEVAFDSMKNEWTSTPILWERNSKANTDLMLSLVDEENKKPLEEGQQYHQQPKYDRPHVNLALPEIGEDVIVWVNSKDDEAYFQTIQESTSGKLDSTLVNQARVQTGSDAPLMLERLTMKQAEDLRKQGTSVIQVEDAVKTGERFGKVDASSIARSQWLDKKQESRTRLDYQHNQWVDFQGWEKSQPKLVKVEEIVGGNKVDLDIPPVEMGNISERDDKFWSGVVLKVPNEAGGVRSFKFPMEDPSVPSNGDEPYGFLLELSDEESKKSEARGEFIVTPDSLRKTWNNFGKVDKSALHWQKQIDDSREASNSAAKLDKETADKIVGKIRNL